MGLTPSRFWSLFVLSISLVYGQVDRANLNGTVTDPSGALIANAKVQVVSRETGLTRDVQTGPAGVFNITGLPIGTYDLTISHEGVHTSTVKEIQLFVGQTRTVDARLELGATTTYVDVQAQAEALEESNAQIGAVIESSQLSNIPVNGRNWATLMTLAPGAINVGGGDQRSIRFVGRARDDNN